MNWQPTNELRWAERVLQIEVNNPTPELAFMTVTHQVLQQKWNATPWNESEPIGAEYQWRDVPVEKEA